MANQAGPAGFDVVTGAFSYSGAAITRKLRASGRRVRTLTTNGTHIHEVLTPDDLYAIEDGELVVVVADAVRRYADGRTRYLHFDDDGEIALITDETGAVVSPAPPGPAG